MISDTPHLFAVKAQFDGRRVVLPDDMRGVPPGKVIVIFEDPADDQDRLAWLKAQEGAFAKTWDNPEDEVYDHL